MLSAPPTSIPLPRAAGRPATASPAAGRSPVVRLSHAVEHALGAQRRRHVRGRVPRSARQRRVPARLGGARRVRLVRGEGRGVSD